MTFRTRRPAFTLLAACLFLNGCTAPDSPAAEKSPTDVLLHLPGISGPLAVDRQFVAGLRDAGLKGEVEVIDWTGEDAGLAALFARPRHTEQADRLAERIRQVRREHPDGRLVLSAHSGGTAIVVWALERLPEDVLVEDVLLMAPALSPTYDLTAALRHVRGNAYAFTSPNDLFILGLGTQWFRTMDGKQVDAAGRVGFTRPANADRGQYAKLIAMPYDEAWMKFGNVGDHIGVMQRSFVASILAPLVVRPGDLIRQPEP